MIDGSQREKVERRWKAIFLNFFLATASMDGDLKKVEEFGAA